MLSYHFMRNVAMKKSKKDSFLLIIYLLQAAMSCYTFLTDIKEMMLLWIYAKK